MVQFVSFKSFLTEILQQHYPFHYHEDNPNNKTFGSHHYRFDTSNHHYHVEIYHHDDDDHAEVNFAQHAHNNEKIKKMTITHNEPSSAKVFSTIHHIIAHHIIKHPQLKHLQFSSRNLEPTRVKLYNHFVKRLPYKHTIDKHSLYTNYTIHLKDKK